MNTLELLKQYSTIVADTSDFASLVQYQPQDATTNPTLIYRAASSAHYQSSLVDLFKSMRHSSTQHSLESLLVYFGCEILKLIPGRVSTEVDARLSFNTAATIEQAKRIIKHYKHKGVTPERVLIKIAATYEGIQAARELQKNGIACNMTLIFCLEQAVACAEAKAQLISPFVGRIYDWYKKQAGTAWKEPPADEDPGVQSVRTIYHYFRKKNYPTEIMGASFRNTQQIIALAGCDLLTISPELLQTLQNQTSSVERKLPAAHTDPIKPLDLSESAFRFALNANEMASNKLAEGIGGFVADTEKLEVLIAQHLAS